jgi:predicted porin
MKQKYIVVAFFAAPLFVQADTNIYGVLNAALEHDSITGGASNTGLHDNVSIIGLRGSERLFGPVSTIWQIESRVILGGTDSTRLASTNLGGRQTFIGLDAKEYGKIRMGYLWSQLVEQQLSINQWQSDPEVFNYHSAEQNTGANALLIQNAGHPVKNAIRYDSPSVAGFDGSVMYGFGENKSTSISSASDTIGLNANYAYSNLSLHYTMQRERNPIGGYTVDSNGNITNFYQSGNAKPATVHYFELDYTTEYLFVGLGYERATGYDWADYYSGDAATNANTSVAGTYYSPAAQNLKTRQAAFSIAYTVGPFTPKFSYGKGFNQQKNGVTLADTGYSQFVIGTSYALSKQTTAEISYGRLTLGKNSTSAVNGQTTTLSTIGLGLMHSF